MALNWLMALLVRIAKGKAGQSKMLYDLSFHFVNIFQGGFLVSLLPKMRIGKEEHNSHSRDLK